MVQTDLINLEPFGTFKPGPFVRLLGFGRLSTPEGAGKTGREIRALRKRILRRVLTTSATPFDVLYRGIQFRLRPSENVDDRVIALTGKHPEEDEFNFLSRFPRECLVFVDIGANIGTYSLFFEKMLANDSRIVCFEPHPRTFRRLSENVTLNSAIKIELHNYAIGESESIMNMYEVDSENAGKNTLCESVCEGGNLVAVNVKPLASLLKELAIKKIDVLKIDIEGYEDRALMPYFRDVLPEYWPDYILIEVANRSDWMVDVAEFLEKNGYTPGFRNRLNCHYVRVDSELMRKVT